jgi:Protein of unknown function (DUF2637)
MMSTLTEIARKNHHRAVRFFWGFLIGATTVSLIGNIAHAVLPYLPRIVVQIGAAAVPPIALLAAVHGIALAVRAGASGRIYRWAVSAVAAIGAGAFAVSFLALRDLMRAIGYSSATAWIFPAIIDTAVAVSTLMLVALGDKPARRPRAVSTQIAPAQRPVQGANTHFKAPARRQAQQPSSAQNPVRSAPEGAQTPAPFAPSRVASTQKSAAIAAQADDTDLVSLAADLLKSGATTQPVETVVAVLAATRDGASINAAANASGINYRTAQRIVEGAVEHRQRQLAAVG